MKRRHQLFWLPAASTDLLSAREWYDAQAPGLGEEFLREFWRVIGTIDSSPTTSRVIAAAENGEQLRRAHFDRWPYSALYLHEDGAIIIVALAHDRQHPRGWQSRL